MKFFNELLHNCEETSLNIVKHEEISLSPSAWLKLKFHITFCKCCRNFRKQTKIIDKVLYSHFRDNMEVSQKAPQDLKDKIKLNLKK